MLCIQYDKEDELVEISADHGGIDYLITILQKLKNNTPRHEHLFTKEWGGDDLTSDPQNLSLPVIHHIKIRSCENIPS